ncbi:hypothetical protein [Paraurantiacibacter namhicola]|uniref:Uncharacterized protein n=1 Tax=Paraurantiacibacter namhicola TaxID=645517 RepID=A0A1C7D611_9SPHN|nr:hypothetical protein [Paraurantiacibacter namhicola]ANU06926.1 hypothetical protein A6F65_00604 [Paraurantiacibacter namhicola]
MIDIATVLLMHGLLLVMFARLLTRDELDKEEQPRRPRSGKPAPGDGEADG